jgi:hypothetical protein
MISQPGLLEPSGIHKHNLATASYKGKIKGSKNSKMFLQRDQIIPLITLGHRDPRAFLTELGFSPFSIFFIFLEFIYICNIVHIKVIKNNKFFIKNNTYFFKSYIYK